jgi:hypothetical protein
MNPRSLPLPSASASDKVVLSGSSTLFPPVKTAFPLNSTLTTALTLTYLGLNGGEEEGWKVFTSRLASAVGEAVTDLVSTRGRGKVKVGTQVQSVPPSSIHSRPIYSR